MVPPYGEPIEADPPEPVTRASVFDIAETAITFCHLAKSGTAEDSRRFVEYGEGQQKPLMLHLRDNYPDPKSLEGLSSEEIASRLDVAPEILNIELAHWSKKDARRNALRGLRRWATSVWSRISRAM